MLTDAAVCTLICGTAPLLVSVPHDGRFIPGDIASTMTPAALAMPDTDWHVQRLYGFCRAIGASVLAANCSRYVVDLNRPATDEPLYPGQLATGVCPSHTFAGEPLYRDRGEVGNDERSRRVAAYWQPYHDQLSAELSRLRKRHGMALLWDAHSIASEVPTLFEGRLPDLNLGSFDGGACALPIEQAVFRKALASGYTVVLNGRFKGGYITRRYGSPLNNIHALQLELAQCSYMNEASLRYDPDNAHRLAATLAELLQVFIDSALVTRGEDKPT